MHVHAGNIHDTKGGVYTLEKALYHYPTLIGVCADQGYRGTFKNTFEIFHNIKVDISPRIKNEFEIQPVRWVVERTFGWMTWSRRLSKDYKIKTFYQENRASEKKSGRADTQTEQDALRAEKWSL